jgi:hypothetical protein
LMTWLKEAKVRMLLIKTTTRKLLNWLTQ